MWSFKYGGYEMSWLISVFCEPWRAKYRKLIKLNEFHKFNIK